MTCTSAEYRIKKIMNTLKTNYGVSLDFNQPLERLSEAFNEYKAKQYTIMENSQFGSHVFKPDYNEALLISEALRIYIREIAPTRRRRKK